MARPSKLTPALLTKLDEIADAGKSLTDVCKALDIDPDTFRKWETLNAADATVARFHGMAARVRARANTGMDDKCDGVIEAALNDPDVKATEKAALAIQWKRLHGTHKIEVSGASFASVLDAAEAAAREPNA